MMEVYRGDIFYIKKWGGTIGTEQEAGRPAVIVSNDSGNHFSNSVTVVYLTTQIKNALPTHCEITAREKSTALCETVSTVSKERLGDFVRTCTDREMKRIDECLAIALGIGGDVHYCPEVIDNSQIDDLKMKLEGAERELDEKNARIKELENEKAILLESVEFVPDEENIKLTTERDLYKSLYEQMFERVIAK